MTTNTLNVQFQVSPSVKKKNRPAIKADEVITFCPGCKAFQTLWLDHDRLVLTRKFTQKMDQIYHDCGTTKPCRLYRATHGGIKV